MAQEIGESREAWGMDVMKMAEEFATNTKADRPFYIVYACKEDKGATQRLGRPAFRQVMKAYHSRPPAMLGILVWYVDKAKSEFSFVPELSAPPDIPLDERLLSDKASDASVSVMNQGKKLNALIS
jgi:hypothetical protein